jgi:hypothetical protein
MLKSESLPYEASDHVSKALNIDSSPESAMRLRTLPPQGGTLEPLMYYDAEVTNGGHHQYFWNTHGLFIDLLASGLEYYGATEHLTLFR